MRVARHGYVTSAALALCLVGRAPALGAQESCTIFCTPDLKFEPTVTFENLGNRARVDVGGVVEETESETIFELIFAVGIPTTIPRVGLTLEAIFAPFKKANEHPFTGATPTDEVRDNLPEIEAELNIDLLDEEQTGGWISSHFDIIDKFSPGELPGDGSAYTHKLNLELDTAWHLFSFMPEGRWARNLELELSIDYMVAGIPQAGDLVGDELFLDDASPWSASLVLVMPLAPLVP